MLHYLPNQLARAFDNVPLKAKGQTISGNRLVYGNYHDRRDLVDENDDKVKINYTAQRKIATGDVLKLLQQFQSITPIII